MLAALADDAIRLDDWAAAERRLNRLIALAPQAAALHQLADVYGRQGRRQERRAMLLRILELPSLGLDHASVQNEIASPAESRVSRRSGS